MTRKEFAKIYYPQEFVVEVTSKKRARSWFASKMSCCWGNTIVEGTGWAVISHPSAQHVGDKRTVFVCRAELLQDQPVTH